MNKILISLLICIVVYAEDSINLKPLEPILVSQFKGECYFTLATGLPTKFIIGNGDLKKEIVDIKGRQYLVIGRRPIGRIVDNKTVEFIIDDFGVIIKVITDSIDVGKDGSQYMGHMGIASRSLKFTIDSAGEVSPE